MSLSIVTGRIVCGLAMALICFVGGAAQAETSQATMLQQLRELNGEWNQRTPNFAALPANWSADCEVTLIQTHLRLVIDQLLQADVASLTAEQRAQRAGHIATLEGYMLAGEFPLNTVVDGRRPVFIDPWGTHCAVGYLIAASGNEALARKIDAEYHLAYLRDIDTTGLAQWQANSGLSMAELALIQPSYHYVEVNYPSEIEDLIMGDTAEIRKAVAENPDLVNARCGGKTLLHFAAAAGDLSLCRFLVEMGADVNAESQLAREPSSKETPKPQPPRISVSSSSTIYQVRWNATTKVSSGGGGGLRMGRGGRVFSTNKSSFIAGLLQDRSGGVEGETAMYFATKRAGFATLPTREPPAWQVEWNEDRAAVAAWLKEQGAT